jgi:hypothetical protein
MVMGGISHLQSTVYTSDEINANKIRRQVKRRNLLNPLRCCVAIRFKNKTMQRNAKAGAIAA